MQGRLRQWGALVLSRLCERSLGRLDESGPVTGGEMAQLARDSWGLYDDLARHNLLPCPPGPAREGWRQWSADPVSPPPAW